MKTTVLLSQRNKNKLINIGDYKNKIETQIQTEKCLIWTLQMATTHTWK